MFFPLPPVLTTYVPADREWSEILKTVDATPPYADY